MTPPRRPFVSPLGAAIDVPHLAPHEAFIVVQTLEHIAAAIWDAFGDELDLPVRDDDESEDDPPDDPPW